MMYYKDTEHWTSYGSVESCTKEEAHYVGICSYEELENENSELKAQVELLQDGFNIYCQTNGANSDPLYDGFNSTPAQCLAEVKEQAVEDVKQSTIALMYAKSKQRGEFEGSKFLAAAGVVERELTEFHQIRQAANK